MESEDQTTVGVRAFVYLRSWEHGPECDAYCKAVGYRASFVYDPEGTRYDETFDALLRGEAELIVVWALEDLPPRRVPRVEVVQQMRQEPEAPRHRRPRVFRRPEK